MELVRSPVIDMKKYSTARDHIQDADIPPGKLPDLGGCILRFTVYRDLPLANLVFYQWHVRNIVDGCPAQWLDRTYVYYGPDQDYIFSANNISDLVGDDDIQVSLGCIDMCQYW